MPRSIERSAVLEMLEKCARGHSAREATHSIIVKWNGRSFPLPRGRHGRSDNVRIGTSQVRTMVRQLEIDEHCAGEMLPELAGTF